MLRIGFYQFRPWFGQVKKNLDKVVQALQDVSADLVVLPELPFTGYYFKIDPVCNIQPRFQNCMRLTGRWNPNTSRWKRDAM